MRERDGEKQGERQTQGVMAGEKKSRWTEGRTEERFGNSQSGERGENSQKGEGTFTLGSLIKL